MPSKSHIGIVGFGRIGQYLAERIGETPALELDFVCEQRTDAVGDLDVDVFADPGSVGVRSVDLVVEAATASVVATHGTSLLSNGDLLIMSTTALADVDLEEELTETAEEEGARLFVPHGAILGMDGLQDGRPSVESVSITTRKSPDNIDFSQATVDPEEIEGETTLYDGPTRGICDRFPRNVNSHATVAVAGLGFDRTNSTLIADPAASDATHRIVAEGEGTRLEIRRSSAIEGVTGSYTLDSIWGTVGRILDDGPGLAVV